jgi:hypothetical protein
MKTRLNIVVTFEEISSKRFAATARHENTSTRGQGASADVAVYRAVQDLIVAYQTAEESELEGTTEPEQRDPRKGTYLIAAGRRVGERCVFQRFLAELEAGELWEVKFEDGEIGREKSRFLERAR